MPIKVSQNKLRVVMALNPITSCFLLCLGFANGIQDELRTRLEDVRRSNRLGLRDLSTTSSNLCIRGRDPEEHATKPSISRYHLQNTDSPVVLSFHCATVQSHNHMRLRSEQVKVITIILVELTTQ